MLLTLYHLIIILFFMSVLGYVLIVIKEKLYMSKNIIVIENKHLSKEDINEIDINEFIFNGKKVNSGDEIKITTSKKEILNGILIGGNRANKSIHIITFNNEIKKLSIDSILKFKIISKYGKLFNY